MSAGTLYVCAVPIGNLADASPRLREVLSSVHAIACEDTRTTGRLLELLGVERGHARLLAHHDHNEQASAVGVVALLLDGHDVALVSDAGTPAISDPGTTLVRAAHEARIEVRAVVGPSSVAAAVSVAGANGNGFRFAGFLPRGAAAIEQLVRAHASDVLVTLESPRRVRDALGVVAHTQPKRIITVCRELTKLHEQVVRGTASEVLAGLGEAEVRGEIVLVLDAMVDDEVGDTAPAAALALARDLVAAGMRTKDAARMASEHVGGRTRAIYEALNIAT